MLVDRRVNAAKLSEFWYMNTQLSLSLSLSLSLAERYQNETLPDICGCRHRSIRCANVFCICDIVDTVGTVSYDELEVHCTEDWNVARVANMITCWVIVHVQCT